MTKTFEVQTRTISDGWVNIWHYEQDGVTKPETFPTFEAAQAGLDEFLADIDHEIKDGFRAPDQAYDRNDYRIVEILDDDILGALKAAQDFIEGFRDDPAQEAIGQLIDRITMAIAHAEKELPKPLSHDELLRLQGFDGDLGAKR